MPNKLSGKEWAELVERGLKRHEFDLAHQRERLLRHYLPIPIAIGVAACGLYILLWGWESWFKTFLSWTIGVTIVTALVAIFARPGRRRR